MKPVAYILLTFFAATVAIDRVYACAMCQSLGFKNHQQYLEDQRVAARVNVLKAQAAEAAKAKTDTDKLVDKLSADSKPKTPKVRPRGNDVAPVSNTVQDTDFQPVRDSSPFSSPFQRKSLGN